ncbi:hypothetical protein, partial [Salmonella sp. s51933]|uniref:hypothetical protein n=1 Tax=Salmonella sp. s51933 TaxID=3160127 RepID=UPI00375418A9
RYYRSSKQSDNMVEDFTDPGKDNLLDIVEWRMQMFFRPNGTKTYPAKTCGDLHMNYPELKSGDYWVDPDESCKENAILVFCNFERKQTCLYPKQKRYEQVDEKFTYHIHVTQLYLLRHYSRRAEQTITYNCLNSRAWDEHTQKSVTLVGSNEENITRASSRFYRAMTNNCNIKDNKWHKTVLHLSTKQKERIPIVNVKAFDSGKYNIDVGLACYTH